MSITSKSDAVPRGHKSATVSTLRPAPPWEWQEAVRQNPGLTPFFDNLESFVELPEGVAELRGLLLSLAIRGTLVEQDPDDGNAEEILAACDAEKKRLIESKIVKRSKPTPLVAPNERPFDIPGTWAFTRLDRVCSLVTDGEHKTPPRDPSGEVPLGTAKNIRDGFLDFRNTDFLTRDVADLCWRRCRPSHNDILMVCVGATTGRLCLLKEPPDFAIVRSVALFRPISKAIYPEYLALTLNSPLGYAQVWAGVKQSAQPCLYISKSKMMLLPLPPLAEQRRIVAKVESLMSLCDTLESYRRERESVRERASRSVLASLTSASAQAPTKQKASSGVPRTETLASAWQRLSDHFEVLLDQPENVPHLRQAILQLAVQGKLVPQDPEDKPLRIESMETLVGKKNMKNGLSPKSTTAETPYRCLRLSALRESVIDCSEAKPVPISDEQALRYAIQKDDIFIVRGNGSKDLVGRAGIVQEQPTNAIYPDLFIKCPLKTELIGPAYFLVAWNSPQSRVELENLAQTTSGIWKVNQGHIASMTLPLPPLAEQKRIVSKVSALLAQCDDLTARLRSRQSTTDALLTALIHQVLNDAVGDR